MDTATNEIQVGEWATILPDAYPVCKPAMQLAQQQQSPVLVVHQCDDGYLTVCTKRGDKLITEDFRPDQLTTKGKSE